jgi:hypothetical protein
MSVWGLGRTSSSYGTNAAWLALIQNNGSPIDPELQLTQDQKNMISHSILSGSGHEEGGQIFTNWEAYVHFRKAKVAMQNIENK